MGLGDLVKKVARAAPLLASVLGGPAAGTAVRALASTFGSDSDPDSIAKAIAADPDAAAKIRELEISQQPKLLELEIKRESLAMDERKGELEAESAARADQAKTQRIELGSADPFVRRARVSVIWAASVSLFLEVILAFVVLFVKDVGFADLADLYMALSIPQGAAFTVAGIFVKKRTDEKAMGAGHAPPPSLLDRFTRRKAGA